MFLADPVFAISTPCNVCLFHRLKIDSEDIVLGPQMELNRMQQQV